MNEDRKLCNHVEVIKQTAFYIQTLSDILRRRECLEFPCRK